MIVKTLPYPSDWATATPQERRLFIEQHEKTLGGTHLLRATEIRFFVRETKD